MAIVVKNSACHCLPEKKIVSEACKDIANILIRALLSFIHIVTHEGGYRLLNMTEIKLQQASKSVRGLYLIHFYTMHIFC